MTSTRRRRAGFRVWFAGATSLAGCGSSTPAPNPPPADVPRVEAPKSPSSDHHERPRALPERELTPFEKFQMRLRADGATELPKFVGGPVIVLDAKHPVIEVACAEAARDLARDWGVDLSAPGWPAATCRNTDATRFVCMQQRSTSNMLLLLFENIDAPRLMAGVETALASKKVMLEIHDRLANATCP